MNVRVLDLDGSIHAQRRLIARHGAAEHDLRWWGPRIRLGCSHTRFRQFESALAASLSEEPEPAVTLYGSGDFHHVSLALLRRLRRPCNLLVLDNHPDWMRGIPFLHCGTWLYHAACLPQVQNIFHVGGNVDFDNSFRRLAPWRLLRSGKITVFPALRCFRGGPWSTVAHEPVRPNGSVDTRRLEGLLYMLRSSLKSYPLYVSLDKDVMPAEVAPVNWDSGHLDLHEVEEIVKQFADVARGDIAGVDVVGDWSPVQTQGLFRRFLHWTEHPQLTITPAQAAERNQRTNMALLNALASITRRAPRALPQAA